MLKMSEYLVISISNTKKKLNRTCPENSFFLPVLSLGLFSRTVLTILNDYHVYGAHPGGQEHSRGQTLRNMASHVYRRAIATSNRANSYAHGIQETRGYTSLLQKGLEGRVVISKYWHIGARLVEGSGWRCLGNDAAQTVSSLTLITRIPHHFSPYRLDSALRPVPQRPTQTNRSKLLSGLTLPGTLWRFACLCELLATLAAGLAFHPLPEA